MRRLLLAAMSSILLLASPVLVLPVRAADLPTGALPLHAEVSEAFGAEATPVLVVRGTVDAASPVTLVLRIDDDWSGSYATRVNEERQVPPGPFRWELPLRGMRTSGGRALRFEGLRAVHLFNASDHGRATVEEFRFEQPAPLPRGSAGYSLGGREAPLLAGFERIAPDDKRIVAGHPAAIRRPGVDPLLASGLRGVERLQLPWDGERASVTLWLEDVGEWESLPHPLRRRVRVNGVDVLDETLTGNEWIRQRYLRGQDIAHRPGSDAWETYGRRRGGQVTVEVPVGKDGVVVELAGDSPAAGFLAGVLIEPGGSAAALAEVTRRRREWFVNAWPVAASLPPEPGDGRKTYVVGEPAGGGLSATVAPGTGHRLEFLLRSPVAVADQPFEVRFEGEAGKFLHASLWTSQWRLDRQSTNANLLRPNDRTLRAGLRLDDAAAGRPTRHLLWIAADAEAPAGRHRGSLVFAAGGTTTRIPFEVEVLGVALPAVAKAAGFYLELPVHLTWFPETEGEAIRQLGCDMSFLGGLGVHGNAPPLPASVANRESELMAMSQQALQNATTSPWLAYAAAKRALSELGPAGSAQAVARAEQDLRTRHLPPPVWSVADEPSNPDQGGAGLAAWVSALRAAAPTARLAGHLNSRDDSRLLGLFDVVLVNDGYGLDLGRLSDTAATGRETWLYNTGKARFTAGFWLWRSPATRYLQWHARMPTADPFDPTDGREGDVQALRPMAGVCAPTPDIDEMVIEMAEGLVDQRWLAWLDGQPSGAAVRREIEDRLGRRWLPASDLGAAEMDGLRQRIEGLARRLM
ncbi:MAG: hypothetical protein U1E23_10425 [Reyranellaceae bacterium]